MATDSRWATSAINTAREGNPLVPPQVWTHLADLLAGKLSEHALSARELVDASKNLLAEVAAAPSEGKTTCD